MSDIDEAALRAAMSHLGRKGAEASWAKTVDRNARTAPARAALDRKFLDAADGDEEQAALLRKAHYRALAKKSAVARSKKVEER